MFVSGALEVAVQRAGKLGSHGTVHRPRVPLSSQVEVARPVRDDRGDVEAGRRRLLIGLQGVRQPVRLRTLTGSPAGGIDRQAVQRDPGRLGARRLDDLPHEHALLDLDRGHGEMLFRPVHPGDQSALDGDGQRRRLVRS